METKGKETYVLEHLRPYLIQSPGIRNVLEALRFNISDLEYRLILRKLEKQDEVSSWNILLDAIKRSPTSEAFTEVRRIVYYDENFLHITEIFENRCKEVGLGSDNIAPFEPIMGQNKTELGLHDDGSAMVFQSFMELIPHWSAQKEDRANFESQCDKLLESGYKFRYIVVSSYVDDLMNAGGLTVKKLKDARTALQYMLPYAFNLYQYPDQKEYRIIKKYTAYYMCYIHDNLKSAPEIADTIFRTMGYKAGRFPDELHLESVSRSITEVAFELYLCDLEFGRIISIVEDAELRYGMAVDETIGIWQALLQKNRGTWRRDIVDVFLANHMNEKGITDRLKSNEAKRISPVVGGAIMREAVSIKKPVDTMGMQHDPSLYAPRYPDAGAVSRVQDALMKDRSNFTKDVGMEMATEKPVDTMGMQYDPSSYISRHLNSGAMSRVQDAQMKDRSNFTTDPVGMGSQYSREDSEEWMYGGNSSKPGHDNVANDPVNQMPALIEGSTYNTGGSGRQTWAPSTERSTENERYYGPEGSYRTGVGQGTELRNPPIGIYGNMPPGYRSDYSGKPNIERADFDNPAYGSNLKIMHPPKDEDIYSNVVTSGTTLGDATYGDPYSYASITASSKKDEDLYANMKGTGTKLGDSTHLDGYYYSSITASSEKDEAIYANTRAGSSTIGYTPYATAPYASILASSKMPGSQRYHSEMHVTPQVSYSSSQMGYQSQGMSSNEVDSLRDGTANYQSQGMSSNELDSLRDGKAKLPPIDASSAKSVDSRSTNREQSNSRREGYDNVAVNSVTAGRLTNPSRYVDTGVSRIPYENHAGSIRGVDYAKPLASGYPDPRLQYDSSNTGLGRNLDKVDIGAQGVHAAQRPSLIDDKGVAGIRDPARMDVLKREELEKRVAESANRARLTQRTKNYLPLENVGPDGYDKPGNQFSQEYPPVSHRVPAYPITRERMAETGLPVTYIGESRLDYTADGRLERSGHSEQPTTKIPSLYSK